MAAPAPQATPSFQRTSSTCAAKFVFSVSHAFFMYSTNAFDADEILPGLWLGSMRAALDSQGLRKHNIASVLTVAANMIEFTERPTAAPAAADDATTVSAEPGDDNNQNDADKEEEVEEEEAADEPWTCANHAAVDVYDMSSENLLAGLDAALAFLDECLAQGPVLVHCAAGVSRSSTVVIAYLMTRRGMTAENALALVRAKRSIVQPNSGFMRQLHLLELHQGNVQQALRAYQNSDV